MRIRTLARTAALLPAGIALAAAGVHAEESSITLYGILDVAVANDQHTFNFDGYHPVGVNPTVTKGTESATGLLNGGLSQTRWGLKGREDLGDGLAAVFLLESAFNLPSGATSSAAESLANNKSTGPNMSADSAISGQMFSRGAYAGLSSASWGTLTFGRHQSFFLENIVAFDPMQGSQAFSPIGFSGTYGGGGATDDSRVDSSMKYSLVTGGFTLGALYKFGGVAGSSGAQSAWEANAVYTAGPFAAQLGYQAFKDSFSLSNNTGTGTIKATAADTRAYMASARYTWAQTTVRAGFEREEYMNPSHPSNDVLVTQVFGYPLAAAPAVTAYPNQKNLNVYWLGANQDLTSAFTLSLGLYHVSQNGYSCATPTAAGCSGSLNYYSLLGDYKFSKRTDTYLGVMESTVSGGPANALIVTGTTPAETKNRLIAVGIRHRF